MGEYSLLINLWRPHGLEIQLKLKQPFKRRPHGLEIQLKLKQPFKPVYYWSICGDTRFENSIGAKFVLDYSTDFF